MDGERSPMRTGFLLSFASLIVVIAGMKAASPIVIPLLVSLFLALILAPAMFFLKRRGLPTWAALSLIVVASTEMGIGDNNETHPVERISCSL